MDDTSDGTLKELEKNYCPPLDPALFTAIVSDYDVSDSAQLRQLQETLDTLKLSAWEQEDLPFDPSGTSGLAPVIGNDGDGFVSEPSVSLNDASRSRDTDLTSELSSLCLNNQGLQPRAMPSRMSYIVGPNGTLSLSGATEDDKVYYLTEMFPSVERYTIQHTLKKSNGDVERSMDVLLNLAFFEQAPSIEGGITISVPKGVDGFEGSESGRKKGRKRKGKNKTSRSEGFSSPLSAEFDPLVPVVSPAVNKWDTAQKDVTFICSRTFPILSKEVVASKYHANGASLSATIQALASMHAPKQERDIHDHPVMAAQVAELTQEFPNIPPPILSGLLRITRNSISAAHELAEELLASPAPQPATELVKITMSPPPLDLDETLPKKSTAGSRSPVQDYTQVSGSAGYHFSAGAEAFGKATAAYKRGKSDRLMGGAAAYYSSVGREHLERAKQDAAAAADALADSQSTWDSLDLHGVSVQDAVRITNERVSEWWESLGDGKYMRGRDGDPARGGYRIITGLGRHSHDGTSRLGPAVAKMLAREGWRVEVGQGVLTVVGAVRKR